MDKTKYYVAKYVLDGTVQDYDIFIGESLESASNYAQRHKHSTALSELVYVKEFPSLYAAMMYVAEIQAQENKDTESGQEGNGQPEMSN